VKYKSMAILIAVLLTARATNAAAQDKFEKKVSDPVAVGSKTKYADLLKLLFTDFSQGDATAYTRSSPPNASK
jgi:hypothetical protein